MTSCGGWIGAIAFITVVLVNVLRGIDFTVFFARSIIALAVGYVAGCLFGLIGFMIVRESLSKPQESSSEEPPQELPQEPVRSTGRRKG